MNQWAKSHCVTMDACVRPCCFPDSLKHLCNMALLFAYSCKMSSNGNRPASPCHLQTSLHAKYTLKSLLQPPRSLKFTSQPFLKTNYNSCHLSVSWGYVQSGLSGHLYLFSDHTVLISKQCAKVWAGLESRRPLAWKRSKLDTILVIEPWCRSG